VVGHNKKGTDVAVSASSGCKTKNKEATLDLEEALLTQTGRLALAVTQVVELGAADFGLAQHFHLFNALAKEREGAFDAYTV
jgi:hypothetical protein